MVGNEDSSWERESSVRPLRELFFDLLYERRAFSFSRQCIAKQKPQVLCECACGQPHEAFVLAPLPLPGAVTDLEGTCIVRIDKEARSGANQLQYFE